MNVDERVRTLEYTLARMEETHDRIADSLERLVRLETMHSETREGLSRSFQFTERLSKEIDSRLSAIETRLKAIEDRQPVTNLVIYTVGIAVLGLLAAAGASFLRIIGMEGSP